MTSLDVLHRATQGTEVVQILEDVAYLRRWQIVAQVVAKPRRLGLNLDRTCRRWQRASVKRHAGETRMLRHQCLAY
jgi:hypothetical protein